jgi:hypothetical protein
MPSQFTASGIGSAVPASALGIEVTITYTTAIPASIIPPSTKPPVTISPVVTAETVVIDQTITTLISGSAMLTQSIEDVLSNKTVQGTTIPGFTIAGTTIPPHIATMTTTEAVSYSTDTLTTSSTMSPKKNGSIDTKIPCICGCFLGLLLSFTI